MMSCCHSGSWLVLESQSSADTVGGRASDGRCVGYVVLTACIH